jgi:hypothetical protein
MGNLKPGATYIYENVDGIVYAREAHSLERIEVGRTNQRVEKDKMEWDLWKEIIEKSQTNAALQAELERVKMIYCLIKEEKTTVEWHPV